MKALALTALLVLAGCSVDADARFQQVPADSDWWSDDITISHDTVNGVTCYVYHGYQQADSAACLTRS